MRPPQFPPDQDLGPNDKSVTTIIEADRSHSEARRIVQALRDSYGAPCDVMLLAVPAGKGRAFIDGLAMAMRQAGTLVNTDQWSGS